MAETSRNPDPDVPVPPGGGAAERLREFLAAREVPAPVDDEDAEGHGDASADRDGGRPPAP